MSNTQLIADTTRQEPSIEELWAAAYPTMRTILDNIINGRRAVNANVDSYVQLRLGLGQLDRGTYKPCTRSYGCGPADSPMSTMSLLRKVLAVVPVGSPAAGLLYRLASTVATAAAQRAEELRGIEQQFTEGEQS